MWSVQPHARRPPEPVLRPLSMVTGGKYLLPGPFIHLFTRSLIQRGCSEHTGWEWGALGSERRGSKDARSPQPHGRAPRVGERVPALPLQGLPGEVNYEHALNKGVQRTLLMTRAWSSFEM